MTIRRMTDQRRWQKTIAAISLATILGGCSFGEPKDGPPPVYVPPNTGDPVPRPEPRSRYGNPAAYEQFGRTYRILDTADGYVERGIASWYGKKFHGRRTSSGEAYDMNALSAAHKTLPIPAWVEVRNLKNDRRLVLRVNDRGPFVEHRIIDLSYAAAERLGIVQDGTGLVEVRALSFNGNGQPVAASRPTASPPVRRIPVEPEQSVAEPTAREHVTSEPRNEPAPVAAAANTATTVAEQTPGAESAVEPSVSEATSAATGTGNPSLYAQVGAFSDIDNAERLYIRLRETGFANASIVENLDSTPRLFRVRIGPVNTAELYDELITELSGAGIDQVSLVIE